MFLSKLLWLRGSIVTDEEDFAQRYPEHTKLYGLRIDPADPYSGRNQIVGDFVGFLRSADYTICKFIPAGSSEPFDCWKCNGTGKVKSVFAENRLVICYICDGEGVLTDETPDHYAPANVSAEELVAEFFGIDSQKLDDEKEIMMQDIGSRIESRETIS